MADTIVGIDVGTTKVCTLIAEVDERDRLRVIGVGIAPSKGLRKGVVVNVEEATQAIAQSVEEASRLSGYTVQSAYVGIAGGHISSFNSRGATIIGRADRTITQDDINRAVDAARTIAIPHNRQVLHTIPRGFTLDGQDGIRDPIGMVGFRLEVETHIITAAMTSIRNLVNCVQAAGVAIKDLVLQPLASAEAVLRPEEKEMGVVLVDSGGGTTDIAIFIEGSVWHSLVLEIGGNHLTNDIAVGLRTPFATAEEIKIRYGHAIPEAVEPHEQVDINAFGDGLRQSVPRRELARIIAARAEEMFDLILREIKRSGYDGLLPAGVVLTGGTADLAGFKDLAMSRLELPVRIGTPSNLEGMVARINGPAYATAVGLLLWGMKYGAISERNYGGSSRWKDVYHRFLEWLKVFLPR